MVQQNAPSTDGAFCCTINGRMLSAIRIGYFVITYRVEFYMEGVYCGGSVFYGLMRVE